MVASNVRKRAISERIHELAAEALKWLQLETLNRAKLAECPLCAKSGAPGCYGARERKLHHNYFLLAQ